MIRFIGLMVLSVTMFVSCDVDKNSVMQEHNLKEQLIGLENSHNARELGGYIIGNKKIKDNLLIRTAKLSELSQADSALLAQKYKVQCIYDFRGKEEIVSEPDVVPAGAIHYPLSISFQAEGGNSSQSGMKFDSREDIIKLLLENAEHPAIQQMCTSLYDIIFFDESSQEVYRKFFAHLVEIDPSNGAVLWHCTQGKDRAGCASAMILAALGADRNLIMADFMLSKDYYDPMVQYINTTTQTQRDVINTLISANPVIFEASLDKIDAKYGSFANYLTECIGVTPQMMQVLKDKFLK